MNKPPKNADRDRYYFVVPNSARTISGVAGLYVGEQGDYVILHFGDGPARGFPWSEVEPVETKPTHSQTGTADDTVSGATS